MSVELTLRSEIVKMLRPLRAFPIENNADVGTPDICCIAGFIELKLGTRPVSHQSRVVVDVRNAQKIWMSNWCRAGGKAWFLTIVDRLWLVHDGLWGADFLGKVTETTLKENAVWFYVGSPTDAELTNVFTMLRS